MKVIITLEDFYLLRLVYIIVAWYVFHKFPFEAILGIGIQILFEN